MDIQQLISFDQQLLLQINGSDSLFWDGFMWIATNMRTWIPMAIVLLYVIFKNNKIKETLLIIGLIALVFTLSDQISSGLCKPFFARFRPTQDPELMYQIDIVNGYRGGIYGFTSSHAANTFGLALFIISDKELVIKYFSLHLGSNKRLFTHVFRCTLSWRYSFRNIDRTRSGYSCILSVSLSTEKIHEPATLYIQPIHQQRIFN